MDTKGTDAHARSDDETESDPEPMDLIEFLQSSPLAKAIAAGEFELPERSRESGREIEL